MIVHRYLTEFIGRFFLVFTVCLTAPLNSVLTPHPGGRSHEVVGGSGLTVGVSSVVINTSLTSHAINLAG
jgi:hypothetical protein